MTWATSPRRDLIRLIRRLVLTVVIAGAGVTVATVWQLDNLALSPAFFTVASALLAVGLFASTSSIPLAELWTNCRVVITAVTVGVLVKAVLITVVMYAAFRDPAYLVLGVAMAQIDPLSVAALRSGSRLSQRGRAILAAWSSFDDPVTTVLVILLAGLAVQLGAGGGPGTGASLLTTPAGVLGNVLLLGGAALLWYLLRKLPGRPEQDKSPAWAWQTLAILLLLGIATVAVTEFLMLGLAVVGLFFRPVTEWLLARATAVALVVATFLLGLIVAGGVNLVQGIALGCTAYLAQVAVGAIVARCLPGDRLRLALSQQSGITAIILALLLEPVIPGTVAVVAPAILVVNLLHLVANGLVDRREDRKQPAAQKTDPDDTPAPTTGAALVGVPVRLTGRTAPGPPPGRRYRDAPT